MIILTDDKTKRLNIKEFRDKGYLQELNRQFLHPLGLSLDIYVDDKGNEVLNSIWDCRDDEEGIYYNLEESTAARKLIFKKKHAYIDEEKKRRETLRIAALGFWEEPID